MSEKYGISMVQARKMMNDAFIRYYNTRKQIEAEGKTVSRDPKMDHAIKHMRMKPYGGRA